MVFRRGFIGPLLQTLMANLRLFMSPNTAIRLKERKSNVLRDYLEVAKNYNVTHFLIMSSTERGPYLRLLRLPGGPTFTFSIDAYSLCRDVLKAQTHPHTMRYEHLSPPALILSGFQGTRPEVELTKLAFQGLFPAIDVARVAISQIKRVALVHYDGKHDVFHVRHYLIKAHDSGLERRVGELAKAPDLRDYHDVAEWVLDAGAAAPAEDGESPAVSDPLRKKGIRLFENGPRLDLRLIKIEEGINAGRVIFHRYESRTAEERAEQERAAQEREAKRLKQHKEKIRRARDAEQRRELETRAQAKQELEKADRLAASLQNIESYRSEIGEEPTEDVRAALEAASADHTLMRAKFGTRTRGRSERRGGGTQGGGHEGIKKRRGGAHDGHGIGKRPSLKK